MPLTGERERNARHFGAIVRLKPGVSISEANAEAATVAARLARAFPKTNEGIGARIVPIWKAQSGVSSILASPLAILGAACGLVLLIACANVTNLLLARSASRQREFGIRAALGAGPGRLSRQLVFESLLLAALATLAGLPLALWSAGPPRVSRAAYGIAGVLRRPTERSGIPFCCLDLPGFRPDFRSSARVSVGAAQRSGCTEARSKRRYTERALAAPLRAAGGSRSGAGARGSRDARTVSPKPLRIGEHSGRFRSPQRDGVPSFSVDEQLHSQRGAAVLATAPPAPARRAGGDGRRLFRLDTARLRAGEMDRRSGRRRTRRGPARTWTCITPRCRPATSTC